MANDVLKGDSWEVIPPESEEVNQPSEILKADTVEALPVGVPSWSWVGRPLNVPVESTRYGAQYLDTLNKNLAGRAGFLETITPGTDTIPFVGDVVSLKDLVDVPFIAQKILNGEEVTDDELVKFNYLMEENTRERDQSWFGDVGAGLKNWLKYSLEFKLIALTWGALGAAKAGTLTAGMGARAAAKVAYDSFSAAGQTLGKGVQAAVKTAWGQKAGAKYLADVTAKGLGAAAHVAAGGLVMAPVDQAIKGLTAMATGTDVLSRNQLYTELQQVYEG